MFLQTLPDHARGLLKRLGELPAVASFYLAGGSALAFHLGHRISVDLDFFTEQDSYDSEMLLLDLQKVGPVVIQQQHPGTTLNVTIAEMRVGFFIYPYPVLEEFQTLWGVRVAGILDLALMKLAAIGQRGRKRDFIDLYFICREHYALDQLLARMPEKFPKVTYPSYHLLRALAYFRDAEPDSMPQMLVPCRWQDVKRFFEGEVRRRMQELLQ